jgi:uncharacterized protein
VVARVGPDNPVTTLERRASPAEPRAEGRSLSGYAARFNVEARIGDAFTEVIMPGAFAVSLRSRDIVALLDHDRTQILGRTKSGTLKLSEDATGLVFALDLPATSLANDLLELAKRGDIGGASFGFLPVDQSWPAKDRRVLRSVDLHEVSIVSAWPAYEGTSVNVRRLQDAAEGRHQMTRVRLRLLAEAG